MIIHVKQDTTHLTTIHKQKIVRQNKTEKLSKISKQANKSGSFNAETYRLFHDNIKGVKFIFVINSFFPWEAAPFNQSILCHPPLVTLQCLLFAI